MGSRIFYMHRVWRTVSWCNSCDDSGQDERESSVPLHCWKLFQIVLVSACRWGPRRLQPRDTVGGEDVKDVCTDETDGEISSELYRDWLWDGNFKFCLIFTHFSRFSPFSGYIWWNNTLSSLENFSLNSILFFLFLMSHPDNGGFLKIAQKRDSISKKTSFCIMVINTDHQESWFLSVGHPLCALR